MERDASVDHHGGMDHLSSPFQPGCCDPTCRSLATRRRPMRVGATVEELWTCERHAAGCHAIGCRDEPTEQALLLVDGRLQSSDACRRHARAAGGRRTRWWLRAG
ncbi:MAG TPA: hypothetical protein VHK89_08605 [Actinomycetota bacterium]|nr:hypothetical protein [Actinomycetota bacterium]